MTILDEIIEAKVAEIDRIRDETDLSALKYEASQAPPCRDLVEALRSCRGVPIIAEIKRASPSAGKLREVEDVAALATAYEKAGAAALSVLTDKPFFGGSLEDLRTARSTVDLPILRKDFILDSIQLYESRKAGADAVLLIVAALKPQQLRSLFIETRVLGMTPVIEVHNWIELGAALNLRPPIVGINNRDLSTMEVKLETCGRLAPLIPPETIVLAESGIKEPQHVSILLEAGADAFLVGTALMKAPDPAIALDQLCNARR
jgi:indole-3-glycerol phosphate synthase